MENNPIGPLSNIFQEEKKLARSLAEEKACILVRVFGRKTSVLYDAKSLSEILSAEDQTDEMKELIA